MALRRHWSNWHITANLNQRGIGQAAQLESVRRLRDFCHDSLMRPPMLWQWLKHYTGGGREDFTPEEQQYVERIRARVSIERGDGANGSIHAHILLEVQHRTRVHIDPAALSALIKAEFGEQANIRSRFVRGDGDDRDFLLKYISKDTEERVGRETTEPVELYP